MSLDKILEYQKIDQEIYKEELSLRRSSEAQKISAIRTQLGNAYQMLVKLDKEAEDTFADIDGYEKRVNQLYSQDKQVYSVNNVGTVEQLDSMEKSLNAVSEQVFALERDIRRAFKKLDEINADARKNFDMGVNYKKEMDSQTRVLAKNSSDMLAKFKEQREKLESLKKEIDPKLLKSYQALRDSRKMPAFLPYEKGNCSGCGMEIQVEVGDKLKSPGDVAECPNCRRFVYI